MNEERSDNNEKQDKRMRKQQQWRMKRREIMGETSIEKKEEVNEGKQENTNQNIKLKKGNIQRRGKDEKERRLKQNGRKQ